MRRRRADLRHRPLAIVSEVSNRRVVVSACAVARAAGVREGMTFTEANIRCPGIVHAPHEPIRDATALTALARWMAMRFTPIVAVEPPDALFLEVGGCERLFGGIDAIVAHVRESLRRFRIAAMLAVAQTPGAAWAFAKYGRQTQQSEISNLKSEISNSKSHPHVSPLKTDMRIDKGECGLQKSPRYLAAPSRGLSVWEKAGVRPGGAKISNSACEFPNIKSEMSQALTLTLSQKQRGPDSSLADLPPAALRIAPEIADTLAHLGVVTIRQLVGLPRDALPSRFGKQLLLRLDQATGRVPEPLVAVECRTPIVVSREWDGPVESQEALAYVLDELVMEAIAKLERRGEGARRIEVTFRCPYALPITQPIALSRASRDAKNLKRLMRCMLESLETEEGFNAIKLRVTTAEPIAAARQTSLVDGESEKAGDEVEQLVERLKIRLGDSSLERAELVESHLPERAVRYVAVDELPRAPALRAKRDSPAKASPKNSGADTSDTRTAGTVTLQPRPLKLLTTPVEVGVIVSPSDDREGHPIAFTHAGQVHRLRAALGPERVAGIWWTGHDKTRDYFDVTDEAGERFWIFRVLETWKWYLHGIF